MNIKTISATGFALAAALTLTSGAVLASGNAAQPTLVGIAAAGDAVPMDDEPTPELGLTITEPLPGAKIKVGPDGKANFDFGVYLKVKNVPTSGGTPKIFWQVSSPETQHARQSKDWDKAITSDGVYEMTLPAKDVGVETVGTWTVWFTVVFNGANSNTPKVSFEVY